MSTYIVYKGQLYKANDELYHHGVKGQKWGVRRFQNKNGSLTPAGKERYNKSSQTRKYTPEEEAFLSGKKSFDESVEAIAGKDGSRLYPVCECSALHIRNKIHTAVESNDFDKLSDVSDYDTFFTDVKSKEGVYLGYSAVFDEGSDRFGKYITDDDLKGASLRFSACRDTGNGTFAVFDDVEIPFDMNDKHKVQRVIIDAKIVGNTSKRKSVSGEALIECSVSDIMCGYIPYDKIAIVTKGDTLLYHSALYHHGIKGQKWGVRRFQNKNGSLTPEGKERYNKSSQTRKYSPEEEDFLSGRKSIEDSARAIVGKTGNYDWAYTYKMSPESRDEYHKAIESGDVNKVREVDYYDTDVELNIQTKNGDYASRYSDVQGGSVRLSMVKKISAKTYAVIDNADVSWDTSDGTKTQRAIIDAKIISDNPAVKNMSAKLLIEGKVDRIYYDSYGSDCVETLLIWQPNGDTAKPYAKSDDDYRIG